MAVQVASVGAAIGRAAEDLDRHDQPMLAGYARRLGEGVEQASHTLHDKGVDELLGMVGDFARRQPALLIGGAALLGFVASRFAKASAQHDYSSASPAGRQQSPLAGEPTIREPWPTAGASSGSAGSGTIGSGSAASGSRSSSMAGGPAGAGGSSFRSSEGGY
jgi:hypothetical protein